MNTQQSIIIRSAELDDIAQLFRISVDAHKSSYEGLIPQENIARFDKRYTLNEENEAKYSKRMANRIQYPDWRVWVAVDENTNEIAGYTLAHIISPTFLQKHGLFIRPDYQGKGVGSQLFAISLTAIESGTIQLSVIDQNSRAIHVYEKSGFTVVGNDEKTYYGANQIVMQFHK